MNAFNWGWWLNAASEGLTSRNLALLLWAGLAVLTISLLVLARTRWGQARPMAVCVFLSLYAHVLMGGYAYTTRLFVEAPLPPREPAIQISYISAGPADVDEAEESDETVSSAPSEPAPWERLAAPNAASPEIASPERREAAPMTEPMRVQEVVEPTELAITPSEVEPQEEPDRSRQDEPTAPEITPAIALTAYARPEDRARSMRAGFQLHLSKPVEMTELLVSIVKVCGRGAAIPLTR